MRSGAASFRVLNSNDLIPVRFLTSFASLSSPAPSEAVRVAAGRLFLACRQGTGLSSADFAAASIVERVDDPLVRLSFGHAHGSALVFCGLYQEALATIDRQIAELERYGLAFALPHSYLVKAAALQGMRRFGEAMRALDKVDRLSGQEQYVDTSVITLRSLTSLLRGDVERAREMLGAETLRTRAAFDARRILRGSCASEACLPAMNQEAIRNAQLAVDISTAIEPRVLATFAQRHRRP